MVVKNKVNDNLQIIHLEETVRKQQEEITELKKMVVDLGEKITKDKEQDQRKEEEAKVSGINYWTRDITPCNRNNFFVCGVCEKVPNTFHFLKVRTCSPKCSVIIEEIINKSGKDLK